MTTDRRAALRRSRRRTHAAVYGSAAAAFAIAAGWLGLEMTQGRDPALGPATATATVAAPERRVVVRRIVTTRRVRVVPSVQASATPPVAVPPAASAPSPAPVPAPAPVQTSAS